MIGQEKSWLKFVHSFFLIVWFHFGSEISFKPGHGFCHMISPSSLIAACLIKKCIIKAPLIKSYSVFTEGIIATKT